jgi:hypothetical protein
MFKGRGAAPDGLQQENSHVRSRVGLLRQMARRKNKRRPVFRVGALQLGHARARIAQGPCTRHTHTSKHTHTHIYKQSHTSTYRHTRTMAAAVASADMPGGIQEGVLPPSPQASSD